MADSIVAIAAGVKALRSGRLNDRALHLLIQHAAPSRSGLSIASIKAVFDGIEALEKTYLKKKAT